MKINEAQHKLLVIATPIGNLQEVSKRTIDALNSVNVILCEDTRMTAKLLHLLGIYDHKKLVSYHNFNESQKLDEAFKWILSTPTAIVSDAGYPTINDPGYNLIAECHKRDIAIEVINGPSSVIHSIVASGMCSNGFMFLGFLGKTKKQRVDKLKQFTSIRTSFVIFEAPHRIKKTLEDIFEVFGDVYIFIGRELTKKNESHYYGRISKLEPITEMGEFCIVVDRNQLEDEIIEEDELIYQKALKIVDGLILNGIRMKDAVKLTANDLKIDQKELYKLKVNDKNDK